MDIADIKDRDLAKLRLHRYSDADLIVLSKDEIRILVENINRAGPDGWIKDVGAGQLFQELMERCESRLRTDSKSLYWLAAPCQVLGNLRSAMYRMDDVQAADLHPTTPL